MSKTILPYDTEEMNEFLSYLDDLRDSGVTNMFAAPDYLESEFDLSTEAARAITSYWMDSFSKRHGTSGKHTL